MLEELKVLHENNASKCPKLDNCFFYLGYKIIFKDNIVIKTIDISGEEYEISPMLNVNFKNGFEKTLKEIRLQEFRKKALFHQKELLKRITLNERKRHENKLNLITNIILKIN